MENQNVTTNDLLTMIGQKEVQIAVLQNQSSQRQKALTAARERISELEKELKPDGTDEEAEPKPASKRGGQKG